MSVSFESTSDIRDAMKRFANAKGAVFSESFPTDQPPEGIFLFQRGERRRWSNGIGLECAGRKCVLFYFEYYVRGFDQNEWYDLYVAWLPHAFPKTTSFQIQGAFSWRAPLILVLVIGILLAAISLAISVAIDHVAVLITGLAFSGMVLFFGPIVILAAKNHADLTRINNYEDKSVSDWFGRRGLYAECVEGSVAVWHERTLGRAYTAGWKRSFQTFEEWMADELQELLDAVSKLQSRPPTVDDEKSH